MEKHSPIPQKETSGYSSIDDLCDDLESLYPDKKFGSRHQSVTEVIHRITQVRHGHKTVSYITSDEGIRETVRGLLDADPTFNKNKTQNVLKKHGFTREEFINS